nr:hypothetical protein [Tanacetum cinerariifolium]
MDFGSSNVVARRGIDEIFECCGETETPKYMKFFIFQEITECMRLIRVIRDEVDIAKSTLGQVNAMITEMKAMDDPFEYADSLGCLKDSKRISGWKIMEGMGEFLDNLMNLRTQLGIGRVDQQYLRMLYRFCMHYCADLMKRQNMTVLVLFISSLFDDNLKVDFDAFWEFNMKKLDTGIIFKCTQMIKRIIMASVDNTSGLVPQRKESLGLGLQCMTPATSSSRLVPNIVSQQACIPPNRDDWDHLFQPMFDEYFNPPSIVVSPVLVAAAPRAVDLVDSLVLTSIEQDDPSTSIPSTQDQEHS